MVTAPMPERSGLAWLTRSVGETSAAVDVPTWWAPLRRASSEPMKAASTPPAMTAPRPTTSATAPSTMSTTFLVMEPPSGADACPYGRSGPPPTPANRRTGHRAHTAAREDARVRRLVDWFMGLFDL